MRKINFEITIDASCELVWEAIETDYKYRLWASAFQEGSYFEGGWYKGDTIRFIAINKDGEKEGMVSEIAERNYPNYISIKHLGYIAHGVDDTTSDEIRKWAPAFENYTLEKLQVNQTLFKIEMDVTDDYYEMFLTLWPKALTRLKEVSELDNAK